SWSIGYACSKAARGPFQPRRASTMRTAALMVAVALLVGGCQLGGDEGGGGSHLVLSVYDQVPAPRTSRPDVGPNELVVTCGPSKLYCPGARESKPSRTYYYVFQGKPQLSGADFALDETRQDFDVATGEPIVLLQFTAEGAQEFYELTRRVPQTSSGTQFAIVVDDELVAAPMFDPRLTPGGIPPGSKVQINGIASVQEARDLALALRQSAR
ncbi:MAG: SecDF P1 head subdomain-containing protein, partial [Gaiellaceae bacterium]